MATSVSVLGFAGSLRKASYNRAALQAAVELAPPDMRLETFDLRSIPLYDGDVEAVGLPDAVREFRARIAAADALLIATPEYNYSMAGVLKNAIDWASRPPDPSAGCPRDRSRTWSDRRRCAPRPARRRRRSPCGAGRSGAGCGRRVPWRTPCGRADCRR